LQSRLGKLGEDWILLGCVSAQGELKIYSCEQRFKPTLGWTLLYFADESKVMLTDEKADKPPRETEAGV